MLKKREIGTVKRQDILENQAKIVFLGIGSNLGQRKINIEKAKFLLAEYIPSKKNQSWFENDLFKQKS